MHSKEKFITRIKKRIEMEGFAKIGAIEVYNLLENELSPPDKLFVDVLVEFVHDQELEVHPIGEMPFGELLFRRANE